MGGAARRANLPPPRPRGLSPAALAPYFWFAGFIHLAAIASRFDVLAAKLPAGAAVAIMLAQFPLLLLSGYFESLLDHGDSPSSFPMWMRIESGAVKFALAFGFIYLAVIAAQTWDVRIGPVDPTPPKDAPTALRAMWFGMFTAGFAMIFFMFAAGVLVPVLRLLAWPFRQLPIMVGAVLALVVGGGLGVLVLAALQSAQIGAFFKASKAAIKADPALAIGVIALTTLGPLLLGALLRRRE